MSSESPLSKSGAPGSHGLRMRLFLKLLIIAILLAVFGVRASHGSDLLLVGAKIYPSPTQPPIEQGSILIHDRRIAGVGPAGSLKALRNATIVDCKGLVITAGFWNSHVHILTPGLIHADELSPDETTAQLQAMLTRWGFTTVFDIASVLKNTNLIRRRIATGATKGPRILTVGEPFWIATPIYVKSFLEANHVDMPTVDSTAEAKMRVQQQIRDGADGIKIFANSIEQGKILTMPEDLARGIVEEAHAHGRPVFAHVSNNAGIEVALHSGVDIMAHTTPNDAPWNAAFALRLVAPAWRSLQLSPSGSLSPAKAHFGSRSGAGDGTRRPAVERISARGW